MKELQTTLPKPLRLVEKKEYSAALISAFIILETKWRDVLIKSDVDFEKSRLTFSESLYLASRLNILSLKKETIQELISYRNKLIHGHIKLEFNKTKEYVKLVMGIVSELENVNRK